jgi:predicted phosphodiesterase
MRILLLADLHARSDWFHWVANRGSKDADLTVIAGDLLDGFDPSGLLPQMIRLRKWTQAFPGALALSSGNHDANLEGASVASELPEVGDPEAARGILRHGHWMDSLERPGLVTDRRSQVLEVVGEPLIVTTTPFYPGAAGPRFCSQLWDAGRELRVVTGAPWIVLNHEPPANTKVGGIYGDTSLFYRIQEYQPDYVACGHLHSQPYLDDFADRIGRTWCFNPGAPDAKEMARARTPNHILVDTGAGTAAWHASPAAGRAPIIRTLSFAQPR